MEALQILLFAPCVKHRGFLKVIQLYFRQGPTGLLIKVMHLGGGGVYTGAPSMRCERERASRQKTCGKRRLGCIRKKRLSLRGTGQRGQELCFSSE